VICVDPEIQRENDITSYTKEVIDTLVSTLNTFGLELGHKAGEKDGIIDVGGILQTEAIHGIEKLPIPDVENKVLFKYLGIPICATG
jgi:hypothetical protein